MLVIVGTDEVAASIGHTDVAANLLVEQSPAKLLPVSTMSSACWPQKTARLQLMSNLRM